MKERNPFPWIIEILQAQISTKNMCKHASKCVKKSHFCVDHSQKISSSLICLVAVREKVLYHTFIQYS